MFNFSNIDPIEFEEICCEILEKITKQSCRIFAKGRDGGIDIQSNKNPKIIGQAKLYLGSSQSVTIHNIKNEFNRIKKREIEQYYIFVGRELSPEKVEEIYEQFKDYMKSKENIYTLKEIDKLLQTEECKDIVQKHIKLWICSTNILEMINNRNTIWDKEILYNDIQKELELFVQTEAYNQCKEILEKERTLLILGAPGIGKTTISKMLALYYLQKGYETKYIDSTNLRDLKKSLSLDYNKKEFIFIDDCLGQSYIELTKENESDLVKFIKFVKNNPNKTLLLNSRITVYKEALKRNYDFEKINKNKEKGIQILEIKEFSNIEKALILSKYLKVKKVPPEYQKEIIKNAKYMEIVKSKNFNPRIIDYMTEESKYKNIQPKNYVHEILEALKKSEYAWNDEFCYKIRKTDRIFLYTLYSISSHKVKEKILKRAFLERLKFENIDTTMNIYEDTLKRLNESFVKIIVTPKGRYITALNPSINDFIDKKLSENEMEQEKIKKCIVAVEQCERLIKTDAEKKEFISKKIEQEKFLQMETNEYESIEQIYLQYAIICEKLENTKINNVLKKLENTANRCIVFSKYISLEKVFSKMYYNKKYQKEMQETFLDAKNIIKIIEKTDIEEAINIIRIATENKEEKLQNKEILIEYIQEELKAEVKYFSEDIIEMDVGLDDIVASEIEELKEEYEYNEKTLQNSEEEFKEELYEKVKKSFEFVIITEIERYLDDLYNDMPEIIYKDIKLIDVEPYINETMIENLADKYIKLVYDTPERDYNYYKKYIYDGNLLNKDYKENETIHNIFKEINTIRDQ